MTISETSKQIRNKLKNIYPTPEIDAFTEIIFHHLFQYKRLDILLNAQTSVLPEFEIQIYNIIHQLEQYRPIQYIIGSTDFYDLPFLVNEAVLIPRPETEELVDWIITDYKSLTPNVLDIGTGSGCIPVSVAKHLKGSSVTAIDISTEALKVAAENASKNQVQVNFIKLDILNDCPPEFKPFDVIVSNPPYITNNQKEKMEHNVLDYEPHLALFVPDNDPLIFYKGIASFAQKHLKKTGALYFEINEELSRETSDVICKYGFSTEPRKDIHGKYRMIKACWK
jgi:release factor glutamine methyltransferase